MSENKVLNTANKILTATAFATSWHTTLVQMPPSEGYNWNCADNKEGTITFENYNTHKINTIKSDFVFSEDRLPSIIQSVYGRDFGKIDIERAPGDAIGYFYIYDEDKSFNDNKVLLKRLQKEIQKESLPYAALIGG